MCGWALRLALVALLFSRPAHAFQNVAVGAVLPPAALPTVDGATSSYLDGERLSVFVFFRADQEFSEIALAQVAKLQQELQEKPVRWVAIVSDAYPAADVRTLVHRVGLRMPVLIDHGDALYGQLGVVVHPTIGIAEAKGELVAYEPFRKVNYMTVVEARILHALGELSDDGLLAAIDPQAVSDGGDAVRASRYFAFARRLYTLRSYRAARVALDRSTALDSSRPELAALSAAIHARQNECERALAEVATIRGDGDLVALYRKEVTAACAEP